MTFWKREKRRKKKNHFCFTLLTTSIFFLKICHFKAQGPDSISASGVSHLQKHVVQNGDENDQERVCPCGGAGGEDCHRGRWVRTRGSLGWARTCHFLWEKGHEQTHVVPQDSFQKHIPLAGGVWPTCQSSLLIQKFLPVLICRREWNSTYTAESWLKKKSAHVSEALSSIPDTWQMLRKRLPLLTSAANSGLVWESDLGSNPNSATNWLHALWQVIPVFVPYFAHL